MSADNFLAIIQESDGSFAAYDCSASLDYHDVEDYRDGYLVFEAKDIEEAIRKAEFFRLCEYGYHFVNLAKTKAMRRPKRDKMVKAAPKEK
jgi:hypothetical protein